MTNCKYITKNGRCGLKGSYAYRRGCFGEDMCKCREPLTNADRIRGMSDEELADFIFLSPEMEFEICRYCTNGNPTPTDDRGQCLRDGGRCYANDACDAFKNWLRKPAEEEHNG